MQTNVLTGYLFELRMHQLSSEKSQTVIPVDWRLKEEKHVQQGL